MRAPVKSSGVRVLADQAERNGWPTCAAIIKSGCPSRVGQVCGALATHDSGTACPYHCAAFRERARRSARGGTPKRNAIRRRVRRALLAQAAERLDRRPAR